MFLDSGFWRRWWQKWSLTTKTGRRCTPIYIRCCVWWRFNYRKGKFLWLFYCCTPRAVWIFIPLLGCRKICSESFVIQVYETTTSALVKDILTGYNATVFAYGATGAGKTHTMVGSTHNPGVMVRAINELFEAVAAHDNPDYFTVC